MRKLLTICAVCVGLSPFASAWPMGESHAKGGSNVAVGGRLLDASCFNRHGAKEKNWCRPRGRTTRYVLAADDGTVYRLTSCSNSGASRLLSSRSTRRRLRHHSGPVWARAKGDLTSRNHLRTDMLEVY